jgi:hypothetical protein
MHGEMAIMTFGNNTTDQKAKNNRNVNIHIYHIIVIHVYYLFKHFIAIIMLSLKTDLNNLLF